MLSSSPRARFLVSIHAPREGCDAELILEQVGVGEVSIHAPREGCDISSESTT